MRSASACSRFQRSRSARLARRSSTSRGAAVDASIHRRPRRRCSPSRAGAPARPASAARADRRARPAKRRRASTRSDESSVANFGVRLRAIAALARILVDAEQLERASAVDRGLDQLPLWFAHALAAVPLVVPVREGAAVALGGVPATAAARFATAEPSWPARPRHHAQRSERGRSCRRGPRRAWARGVRAARARAARGATRRRGCGRAPNRRGRGTPRRGRRPGPPASCARGRAPRGLQGAVRSRRP